MFCLCVFSLSMCFSQQHTALGTCVPYSGERWRRKGSILLNE